MAFAIEHRERIQPRVSYVFDSSHSPASVDHVLPLEGLPTNDSLRNILCDLRSHYRDAMYAKLHIMPDNTYNWRVAQYIENFATFATFDFRGTNSEFDGLPKGLMQLGSLFREILRKHNESVIWKGINPLISATFLESRLGQTIVFDPHITERKIADAIIIKHQFIHRREDITDYYEFDDPNIFYASAAHFYYRKYIKNNRSNILPERLEKDGFFQQDKLIHTIPVLSFTAENLFLHFPDTDFETFILGLPAKIGGKLGFAAAAAVTEDLLKVYESSLNREGGGWNYHNERSDILKGIPAKLRKNYEMWKYENRPDVITSETLAKALSNQSGFWGELFEGSGVRSEMETLFAQSVTYEIRSVYETALREREVIPGLIMILSHVLGYDPETSRRLAAIALFGWGVIVSYDNIIDGHGMRKSVVTENANSGLPVALNNTMLALGELLGKTINDTALTKRILAMLDASCRGDNQTRSLGWNNSRRDYINSMSNLVTAFSWFPEHIGQQTGYAEAGTAFASFLACVHTLGQMNNDIEDIEQNLWKHNEGSDIGQRITLFWKTLVELPEDAVPSEEKQKVKGVYERVRNHIQATGKQPTLNEIPEIAEVLEIGRKHKKEVVRTLYLFIKEIAYEPAKLHLEEGFTRIPIMDKKNLTYHRVLAAGLKQEWNKFCKAGEIDEDE